MAGGCPHAAVGPIKPTVVWRRISSRQVGMSLRSQCTSSRGEKQRPALQSGGLPGRQSQRIPRCLTLNTKPAWRKGLLRKLVPLRGHTPARRALLFQPVASATGRSFPRLTPQTLAARLLQAQAGLRLHDPFQSAVCAPRSWDAFPLFTDAAGQNADGASEKLPSHERRSAAHCGAEF